LDVRWDTGIFFGIPLHTTKKITGTSKGVVVVQSMRRKSEDQQWDVELLQSIQGTPGHQTHQLPKVHEKHWNCQNRGLFQLNNRMLHLKILKPHLTKHTSNLYIVDRAILIDLDIQQDARLVNSYVKVLIDKVFLTTKIVAQELCKGYRRQNMAG